MAGATNFQFSPGQFKGKDADPEQTLERFERYLKNMDRVFRINRPRRATGERIDFDDGDKKDIIQIEGGPDMQDLFEHVGKVVDGNTYNEAVEKIRNALKGRGNRTAAVHKLFSSMAQANQTFDAWHKKVYEFAKTVDWTDYNHDKAAVDAIVMQTSSGKLRQRVLQDNPSYEELVKMGISQEQAKKKAETLPDREGDQITRAVQEARAVQEELRRLTGGKKRAWRQVRGHAKDKM